MRHVLVGLFLMLSVTSLHGDPKPAAKIAAVGLRIVPSNATLWGASPSQRFVVLAKGRDGLERDVTDLAQLDVMHKNVAAIDNAALRARNQGETTLRAAFAGHSAEASVNTLDLDVTIPFSFEREIGRILTKRGCNGSDCHGGVKGRGGFKLSLDAIEPRSDYAWILNGGGFQVLTPEALEPHTPRIQRDAPEDSLLLLKPTRAVPHEGGRRLQEDSDDYRTIVDWIRRGAPYTEKNSPEGTAAAQIERIEVFPSEAILDATGEHRMVVTAYLSNGRHEDVTHQVRYQSLEPNVVRVNLDGVVRAKSAGVAAVLVRFVGHVVSSRFRVLSEPIPAFPDVERNNFIDDYVFAKLEHFHILPSETSSDAEFLRRVCLDVTGSLPPPHRVREFLASRDPNKRTKLVEILLDSPEYDDYWAFLFSDLFRVKGNYGWVHTFYRWVHECIEENKPYDQIARELIAAQGYNGPTRHYLIDLNKPKPVERVVAESFRVFMGRRLDCAQCHNHPFDRWSQNQFWGLAAFFGRMTNTRWATSNVVFDDPNGHEANFGSLGDSLIFRPLIHPRTKDPVTPTFPDGRVLSDTLRRDPRTHLAEWMTSHRYFAETTVNRVWGRFFGRGIVDPVDDFRVDNPPTHPQLLDHLARDFEEHSYDLKHLIRRIVTSRTYQLSSIPNESNIDDRTDYSHALPRPLLSEVLLDAISSASQIPEMFFGTGAIVGTAPKGSRAVQLKHPAAYECSFMDAYGRPLRKTIREDDNGTSLAQALHMLVGKTYTTKLAAKGGRIDQLLSEEASDQTIIEQLYLATLTRYPSNAEENGLIEIVESSPSRRNALADVLWALVSSREFAENH